MSALFNGLLSGIFGSINGAVTESAPKQPDASSKTTSASKGAIPPILPQGATPHKMAPLPLCPHNGQDGISVTDVAEHIGNGEYGSAGRDFVESDWGQQAIQGVQDAVQTIGDEMQKEQP